MGPVQPINLGPDQIDILTRDLVLHDWVSYGGTLTHVVVTRRIAAAVATIAAAGIPIQLLHGAQDRTVPVAIVRDVARRYQLPLTVLAGQPHTLPLSAPDACADLLHTLVGARPPARSGNR
ncbi:MAG: hypothetical protein DCC57_16975 [Chloroflexi bacterium]|nr:MAG: hypothetical protein DCC57_16975 [Chloroflexota bacterium]